MAGPFDFMNPSAGTIPPGSVTNTELADMAARTVKVNATNATASPQDLQGTTALNYLRVNAAGTGLEFGALPIDPGGVTSVFTRTGDVVAASGDYTATQVTNTPAGNIVATTVQAAIDELDAEKAGLALANVFTAAQTINADTVFGFTITKTNDGSLGPLMRTNHVTASAANNDLAFVLQCYGKNSSGADALYGQIYIRALEVTAGSERGEILFIPLLGAGGPLELRVSPNGTVIGDVLTTGGYQGAATLNVASYYGNGVLVIDTQSTLRLRGFTVATLPAAGTAGRIARVTDALAPSWNTAVVGGGAVDVGVRDNGTAWVAF